MGTLCALLLAERGTKVTLWSAFAEQASSLQTDRENKQFLPGHPLPASIEITSADIAAFAAGPDLIVSAVPCQYLRPVWTRLAPHVPATVPVVSITKGVEIDTLLRPTSIISACAQVGPPVCLSGPSIAPEIAERKPASVVVAAEDETIARRVQEGMSTGYFRIYTSADLLGVELAGAVKNVIALAAGMCDGIGAGVNTKAALLTRGLVEITRLGVALGAKADTFRGLAGVGDLATTCFSPVSRNRTAGERFGKGMTCEEVIASTTSVVEGIPTTKALLELAARHDVEMPITEAVASILFENRRPQEAIERLMTRRLRRE